MLAIVHVLTTLAVGGAESVALLLATQQVRSGHKVSVISLEEPPDGALGPLFQEIGVSVERVHKRAGFDLSLPPRLGKRYRRLGANVVHTHNPLPLIYGTLAARTIGARVVHTKHGPHPDRFHRLWLRRLGAAACHAFVSVSEDTASFARQINEVSHDKLRVITNATDLRRFTPQRDTRAATRRGWNVPDDAWVVSTVGRMAVVKNHPLLIRAAAPLLGANVRLVIAGDGPEAIATKALVDDLGLSDWVHLLGETLQIPEVMAASDVFALSSKTEGLPLVLAEAMGSALPVVATSVGGVPKVVIEGETGFLVPAGDTIGLREALAKLQSDRQLAAQLGKHGHRIAQERYSVNRMAAEYLEAYAYAG